MNRKIYIFYTVIISFQIIIGEIYAVDTLDVNVHDTYFVFTGLNFSIFLCIIVGISLFIHFITSLLKKGINKTILFLQLLLISVSLLIINYGIYAIMTNMNDMPRNYYENNYDSFFSIADINLWITLALLILLFSPFLGVINFIITLFKKSKT